MQTMSTKFSNALLACRDYIQAMVIEQIKEQATNPFVIYQSDYVSQEEITISVRGANACSEQEVADAIQDLLERGALKKKRNIFTGSSSYAVTKEAIAGNIVFSN